MNEPLQLFVVSDQEYHLIVLQTLRESLRTGEFPKVASNRQRLTTR